MQVGSNSSFGAAVQSDGNISLGSNNEFFGPLEYGGALSMEQAMSFFAGSTQGTAFLPGVAIFDEISPGTENIVAAPGRVLTLSPGPYGNITVPSGARLNFLPGRFDMASLTIQPSSAVIFNAPAVNLYVVGNVQWSGGVSVASGATAFLQSDGSIVNISVASSFPVNLEDTIAGSQITIGSGVNVLGCISARNLTFDDRSSSAGE
jgi:hypothetical protein